MQICHKPTWRRGQRLQFYPSARHNLNSTLFFGRTVLYSLPLFSVQYTLPPDTSSLHAPLSLFSSIFPTVIQCTVYPSARHKLTPRSLVFVQLYIPYRYSVYSIARSYPSAQHNLKSTLFFGRTLLYSLPLFSVQYSPVPIFPPDTISSLLFRRIIYTVRSLIPYRYSVYSIQFPIVIQFIV